MLSYGQRLEQAVDYLVVWLQIRAPKDTWNLAINGIRKAWDEFNVPMIVIGGEVAPYAVYTNEPWVSPAWHGASNPNTYWIQRACEEAKPVLIAILSGIITQEEYNEMIGVVQTDFTATAQAQAEVKA